MSCINSLHFMDRIDTEGMLSESIQSNRIPTVGVLLSTYNGAKYLVEQVKSIDLQDDVRIVMFCRDDGSSDDTPRLLEELSNDTNGAIRDWHLELGSNIGFNASFESLLKQASGCDFYAFSDQDDVWKSDKLSTAIRCIKDADNAALYGSVVNIVNERLDPIGINTFPGFTYSIPSELIRHRLAGHTLVWNQFLQDAICKYGSLPCWSHDQHVVISAILCGAKLVLDDCAYVMHRRLDSSVTPGGGGLLKRLEHELNMILNPGHRYNRQSLASCILAFDGITIDEKESRFLKACAEGRYLNLLFNNCLDCGLFLGNIEAILSILIGRF